MAFTQDFRTQRRNYNDGDTRIGEKDRLWYDSITNSIRISDGETPGGLAVGGAGGGGDYTLPTATTTVKGGVKVDGTTITISNQVISGFSGSYNDLTNKPTLFDGAYNSLSGKPTLFSGSYADLTNKPTLFSGSYTDLTNKPTIPTNTNQLTNGAGFITGYTETDPVFVAHASYNITSTQITNWDTAYSWGNHAGAGYLTSVGTISYDDLSNKPTLFSGSYTDLTNKPTIYSSAYIGTTSLDFTRSSASQTLNGVSIDGSILWINSTPAPGDPFRTAISAASGNATISLTSGLPGLGSTVSWTFDTTKITFPDASQQTTAWTGSSPTLTTARNINGVSFNGSADITVTAAANTLTGTELKSTVVTSSLTSVGTLTSLTTSGVASITYTPGTAVGVALTATGKDTIGGTGYFDFLRATNTTSGVANGTKTFRLNSTGAIEIINSAYSATILSLSDAGALSVPGPISVSGKQAINGPAFRAYVDTGQAITSGSQQKVTFGAETFDTNSNFSSSRFTPTVEGYYQLNATVRIAGTATTGEYMLVIWKNGSEYARGHNGSGTEIGASFYSLQVSDIAYANGSSDYFEIYIQQTSGGNRDTTAGAPISYFSGCMIRGA